MVLRNTLTSIELIDAAPDLRVDSCLVFQQLAIVFLLRIEKVEQCFFHAGGPGRLNLALDPSLQGDIVDSMFIRDPCYLPGG